MDQWKVICGYHSYKLELSTFKIKISIVHSFIPLACAECHDSLLFSGACSIPLLCTFSCHPSPPTVLPSSFTSSCHLFLGLPLNLVAPKFIHNTLLGILFSSILCTCPNQHKLFNKKSLIVLKFILQYQLDNRCLPSPLLFQNLELRLLWAPVSQSPGSNLLSSSSWEVEAPMVSPECSLGLLWSGRQLKNNPIQWLKDTITVFYIHRTVHRNIFL